MIWLALGIVVVWLGLGVVGRMAWQRRRTGSWGLRLPVTGVSVWGRSGHLAFTAGTMTLGGAVVVAAAWPHLRPQVPLAMAATAAAFATVSMISMLATQLAMGDSWRIGTDPNERTALVTGGPFGTVRNPIFTTMLGTAVGITAMVPSAVAVAGLGMMVAGTELVVRTIEEPYLRRLHGEAYRAYEARTGRFIPWAGRGA